MPVYCLKVDTTTARMGQIVDWIIENTRANRLLVTLPLERQRGAWVPMNPKQLSNGRRLFQKCIIGEMTARAWPGTRLFGQPGLVMLIEFNKKVAATISRAGPRLSRWTNNNRVELPEDICFFREGASWPDFVSVTHHNDAWIIRSKPSRIPFAAEPDNWKELKKFIFSGPWFCVPWRRSAVN